MEQITVVAAEPTVDGAASAVLALRQANSPTRNVFLFPDQLPDFFDRKTQQSYPSVYQLVICGIGVVHTSWDGELLRPKLIECLRDFPGPVRWYSASSWRSEDIAAIRNIIGDQRLRTDATAACCAEIVRRDYSSGTPYFADAMVQLGGGTQGSSAEWMNAWERIIESLKNDLPRLSDAIGPLIDGEPEDYDEGLLERAKEIEERNRRIADDGASDPRPMREYTLTRVEVPVDLHCFWREISAYARSKRGADFCLCHLADRPVLVISRGHEHRMDLRRWARYVTDVIPEAAAIDPAAGAVPLYVRGLANDAGLADEVERALKDGAHLLADD